MGTTGPVLQPGDAFLPVALPPLRHGAPRDALRLRDLGLRPPLLDPADQEQPSMLGELRVSVGHWGHRWSVGNFNQRLAPLSAKLFSQADD